MRKQFLFVLVTFLFLFLNLTNVIADDTTTTTIGETTTSTTTPTTTTLEEATTTVSETTTTIEETTTTTLPDFEIGNFTWDPINPYPGQNLMVFSNMTKSGENDQNVTLHWSMGSDLVCNQTINASSVDTIKEVNCTFAEFSGEKNISLTIDPDNSIEEESEDNNYYSQIISTGLNVTIVGANSSNLDYNQTLALNVSVRYWNDDEPVEDLELINFEIYDQWSSDSNDYRNKTSRLSENDFSMNSSGIYLLGYRVPDISGEILEYGEHQFKVKVKEGNYSTQSSPSTYFLNGPYLTFSFPGLDDIDLKGDNSDTVKFDIDITNEGNKAITGVYLYSIGSSNGENEELSNFEECENADKEIEPGEEITLCSDVELEVRETGNTKITIVAKGTYDSSTVRYQGRSSRIYIEDSGTPTEDDPSSPDSGESQFNEGTPPKKSGGTTSTEEKEYLKILSFPAKVEIEQGKRKTVNVNVKNEDDWEFQDVTLKVTGINSSWLTVIPVGEVELEPLKSYEYRVAFEIPEDAEVKDYSGQFQVSSSFETKKHTFSLSVLPGPELQSSINSTIEDYQNQIQQLEDEINDMRSRGYNTTEAEEKLQQLKDEFNKLLAYRDGGNYKSAYELLDETEDLLNQTASVVSGAFALPTQQLIGITESKWVFSGLVSLLFVVGGYTFWGRHFKVKEKLIGKVKTRKRKKPDIRGKELEDLASQIVRRKRTIKKPKIEEKVKEKPKPEISERMQELETIKNLVKGAKAN